MILRLSLHYAFPHSKSLRSRSIRTMLSVALSLVVVVVVIAIMTFLQTSRFDAIRNVRSFDYTIDGDYSDEISALLPGSVVFTYGEGEALSEGGSYLVRYIDSSYDGGLNIYFGDASSLLVPFSFLENNSWGNVTLSMLRTGTRITTLKNISYEISGVYYTALSSEFDDTMLFLPLSEADENVNMKTAIKGIGEKEYDKLVTSGYTLTSWKESESSLYGAFLVEKALMYGVLSLLFIIIAVSVKEGVVLFNSSRMKEMAELQILGMEKRRIRLISLLSFLAVILSGILLGFILGIVVLIGLERFSSSSNVIMTLSLSLPYAGFLSFSLFMVIITILFTMRENRKREKKEISEVLYAE